MVLTRQQSNRSTPCTPSKLLELPTEVLRDILALAYPADEPRPTDPVCKHLHPLLLELLYSQIRLVSYNSLAAFDRTLRTRPEYGVLVKHFTVRIPWAEEGYGKETKEQPPPSPIKVRDIQELLRTMTTVKEIYLHGSMRLVEVILLPETAGTCLPELTDLDLTSTFRGWDDPWSAWHYAALPFYRKLDSLEITVEREPSSIQSSPPPSLPGPAPLLFPSLSRLDLSGPCASSTSAKDFLGAFNNVLVLRLVDFDSNLSLLPLLKALPDATPLFELTLFSGDHAYDPELEAVLPKFSSLERLELSGTTTTPSPSFYDALRALPQLTSLVFGPYADASTDELAALVAGPRKHPKLEELTLDNVYGEMGTRIEEDAGGVPFDAEHDDGEHRWGIYRDWVRPHWGPFFSLEGLRTLLEVVEGAGVRVSGDAAEAIKVDEAYDRELDFLCDMEAREGTVWE
ncbi:hypothetical protein JCM8097_001070 [Rhodosporidiobolus ruineniae]